MRVAYKRADGFIRFDIEPTGAELSEDKKVHLGQHSARVAFDATWDLPHADLLALSAFLIAGPFAIKELSFEKPISRALAKALEQTRPDLRFGPVDPTLAPRGRPKDGCIGLSFSGGADSFAALELLPSDTELFFLKRIAPETDARENLKLTSAGERASLVLRDAGRQVFIVDSDLEFVRQPIGFADHMACAVPLILSADQRKLDSVSWGTIAEAAYRYGSSTYVNFADRAQYIDYQNLFTKAGLPFCNPVIGVSEVVTSTIMSRSPHQSYVQSCSLGGVEACGACKKCFRKALLDAAISGDWPADDELDHYFQQTGIVKYISTLPIKLENIFAYVTSKYQGKHPMMLALKQRVGGGTLAVSWMERYIPDSLDQAPEERREYIRTELEKYALPMTEQHMSDMKKWSVVDYPTDEKMNAAKIRFRKALAAHQQRFEKV